MVLDLPPLGQADHARIVHLHQISRSTRERLASSVSPVHHRRSRESRLGELNVRSGPAPKRCPRPSSGVTVRHRFLPRRAALPDLPGQLRARQGMTIELVGAPECAGTIGLLTDERMSDATVVRSTTSRTMASRRLRTAQNLLARLFPGRAEEGILEGRTRGCTSGASGHPAVSVPPEPAVGREPAPPRGKHVPGHPEGDGGRGESRRHRGRGGDRVTACICAPPPEGRAAARSQP